jgi:hypothetical protein
MSEMDMLGLQISITQVEKSEWPGCDEISVGMVKAAGAGQTGVKRVFRSFWIEK